MKNTLSTQQSTPEPPCGLEDRAEFLLDACFFSRQFETTISTLLPWAARRMAKALERSLLVRIHPDMIGHETATKEHGNKFAETKEALERIAREFSATRLALSPGWKKGFLLAELERRLEGESFDFGNMARISASFCQPNPELPCYEKKWKVNVLETGRERLSFLVSPFVRLQEHENSAFSRGEQEYDAELPALGKLAARHKTAAITRLIEPRSVAIGLNANGAITEYRRGTKLTRGVKASPTDRMAFGAISLGSFYGSSGVVEGIRRAVSTLANPRGFELSVAEFGIAARYIMPTLPLFPLGEFEKGAKFASGKGESWDSVFNERSNSKTVESVGTEHPLVLLSTRAKRDRDERPSLYVEGIISDIWYRNEWVHRWDDEDRISLADISIASLRDLFDGARVVEGTRGPQARNVKASTDRLE